MQEPTTLEYAVEFAKTPLDKAEALNALARELCNTDSSRSKMLAEDVLRLCDNRADAPEHEHCWHLQKASALLTVGLYNGQTENFRLSLSQSEEALAIYEQTGDKKGQADALNSIGVVYWRLAEYAQALMYYRKSLTLYEDIQDESGQANAILNIGLIYTNFADYAKALEHYHQGLARFEKRGDQRGQLQSLINIGNVYLHLSDYDNAMPHLTKCLAIAETIGDKSIQARSLINIGTIYSQLADYDNAMSHLTKCLAIAETIGDQSFQAHSHLTIGSIHYHRADYEQALDSLTSSHALFEQLGIRRGTVNSLITFGRTFIKRRRFEEAEAHLLKALALCNELGLKRERYDVLEYLAEFYFETGDTARAYHFHKLFHVAKEEVFKQEQQQKLTRLQIVHETEQAKKEAELERVRNAELSKANDALREANRLKTEFLGIAAHDLKNPLSSIRGFAELIMLNPEDFLESHRMAKVIYKSSNQMLRLIQNLLGTVAVESGTLTLHKQTLDAGELTDSVVHIQRHQAKQKFQTIHLETQPACFVNADDLCLRQIVDNLVSNAIKYSPAKKSIWVRVKKIRAVGIQTPLHPPHTHATRTHDMHGHQVRIEVQDEGQGLSDKDHAKLFGKFQRLSAKPTGGESSTGLGLSIVKQLVGLHGGNVWADSAGHGKGTTFFVDLPAVDLGE